MFGAFGLNFFEKPDGSFTARMITPKTGRTLTEEQLDSIKSATEVALGAFVIRVFRGHTFKPAKKRKVANDKS